MKERTGGTTESKAQKIKVANSAPTVQKAEDINFSNVKIEPIFKDMIDFETFAKADYRAVKILLVKQ